MPVVQQERLCADGGQLLLDSATVAAARAAVASLRAYGESTAEALDAGTLIGAAWAGDITVGGAASADLVRLLRTPPAAAAAVVSPRQAGLRHRQAALARHATAAAAALRQAAITAQFGLDTVACRRELARWRSQASTGSMAWVGALPSSGLAMCGAVWRETCRRALGIERGDCGGRCKGCARALTGVHARRCANTGFQVTRHNALRDSLASIATTAAGISGVMTETRHPFVAGAEPSRRMDIVIPEGELALPPPAHDPAGGGKHREACIDVTIVDGTRDAECRKAAANMRP